MNPKLCKACGAPAVPRRRPWICRQMSGAEACGANHGSWRSVETPLSDNPLLRARPSSDLRTSQRVRSFLQSDGRVQQPEAPHWTARSAIVRRAVRNSCLRLMCQSRRIRSRNSAEGAQAPGTGDVAHPGQLRRPISGKLSEPDTRWKMIHTRTLSMKDGPGAELPSRLSVCRHCPA